MKTFALFVLGLTFLAGGALAEEFKGYIADSHCAKEAKAMSADHAGCAKACIKKGAQAVLATEDGKVYKLSDQAKAVKHAGEKVTVTGKLEGDTIQVENIKM
ncbi:MAG TPA: DUF5818 domain-containing protein [Bryobacteraceae bacterium]|nr:DUF5818 domain-containing protein [Bryobacteraceae bacterium]